MDSSFMLLSTMSPKITKNSSQHLQHKAPTSLALKKNIRRSSNFNVCAPARLRPSIVIVESNSEGTSSVESDVKLLNNTPIIIPDSDDDKSVEDVIESNNFLSLSKLATIDEWVHNVYEQTFGCNKKIETPVNQLYNFKNVLNSLPRDHSTDHEASNKERLDDSDSNSETAQTPTKDQEKILNELYRDTWKHLQNDILPKSTPRRKKQITNSNCSKTDVKVNLYADKCKIPVSPWAETLKGLCDSDSSDDASDDNKLAQIQHRLNFQSDGSSSNSSNKKSSDRGSIGYLSDKSKNQVITKPINNLAKISNDENGKIKTKAKQIDKKLTRNKNINNEAGNKCSLLNVNVVDKCTWKITPIKEKGDSNTTKGFLASLSGSVPLPMCDPSARIFRNNFKEYKGELLNRLFVLYNETVFDNNIPKDTLFEWNDRMRGTAGFCYCRRVRRRTGVIERHARIVLSTKVVDSCDRLRDTLIHELCHAATWIVNETANGHGVYWKAWAAKALECFPELPPIKRCHDYKINTKYTYRCVDCGYSIGRHSKSLDIDRKRCGYCYGKFEVLLNKTYKDGGTKAVPVVQKKPLNGFALFVKTHYGTYKTPHLNHAQVMKLLGQKFSELKVST